MGSLIITLFFSNLIDVSDLFFILIQQRVIRFTMKNNYLDRLKIAHFFI